MPKDMSTGEEPFSNNYKKSYGGKKGHVPNADYASAGANVTESRLNRGGDMAFRGKRSGRKGHNSSKMKSY